jgi:oxygen-dependent protoporphyrinogen oxidase
MKRVVIIGGGIAGLSIAWALRRRDPSVDVVLLERAQRAGGNIQTEHVEGYTCEAGPDGFLDNAPGTLRLVQALGLTARLQPSRAAAQRRYVFRRGTLHEVPLSPRALLSTGVLSMRGKARVACEPFVRRRRSADETVHDFAARHVGEEAASVLVGSMVSGIFAGDASALSLRACFPRMWELEEQHGSLVRALIATRRRRKRRPLSSNPATRPTAAPAGRLTSFKTGMSELVDALVGTLSGVIRLGTPALDVRRTASGCWNVMTAAGGLEADALVLAGPSSESADLLRTADPRLARELDEIRYAPLAVVCVGYDAGDIPPLDGFGFLVPRSEGIRILGALWETSIYPDRAAAGKALLRVMIGGACDRAAVTLDDDALLRAVREDLATTMGVTATPEFSRITRHRRGIPQYEVGHLDRLRRIAELTTRHACLFLAGSSYRGVSMNACIAEADAIADAVLTDPARTTRCPMAV